MWRAVSRFHKLTDKEIVDAIRSDSKLLRGYQFDIATQFLVLRVPENGAYHDIDSIGPLKRAFGAVSMNLKHYQIDNDWYLYLFLDDWVRTEAGAYLLTNWLQSRDFSTNEEDLMVLTLGSTMPLPLQARFAWLNENCDVVVKREEISMESAVALFLSDLDKSAISVEQFIDEVSQVEQTNFAPPPALEQPPLPERPKIENMGVA